MFTDVTTGEKRRIDILAQVKLKGEPTVIIVHVENQAYRQQDLNDRTFVYYSRLYEKHRMKYSQEERMQVKKESLRRLVRLQLDPAIMQLVVGFFDQYLKLNEEEEKQLKEEIQELNPQETE